MEICRSTNQVDHQNKSQRKVARPNSFILCVPCNLNEYIRFLLCLHYPRPPPCPLRAFLVAHAAFSTPSCHKDRHFSGNIATRFLPEWTGNDTSPRTISYIFSRFLTTAMRLKRISFVLYSSMRLEMMGTQASSQFDSISPKQQRVKRHPKRMSAFQTTKKR